MAERCELASASTTPRPRATAGLVRDRATPTATRAPSDCAARSVTTTLPSPLCCSRSSSTSPRGGGGPQPLTAACFSLAFGNTGRASRQKGPRLSVRTHATPGAIHAAPESPRERAPLVTPALSTSAPPTVPSGAAPAATAGAACALAPPATTGAVTVTAAGTLTVPCAPPADAPPPAVSCAVAAPVAA